MANPAPPQVQRAVRTPDPGRAGKLTDNCEPTQSEISEVSENSKENESKSDDFENESKSDESDIDFKENEGKLRN